MKPRLFVSDLHLGRDRPQTAQAFLAFCRGPARDAAAVYILGDLFDFWLGDDQLGDAFPASIAAAIRGVTDAGVPVYFAHGNRDFLIGEGFAKATGVVLLPERELVELGGKRTLLSHGDELCTGDVEYQRYRERMRSAKSQRRLMSMPLFVRRLIAWSLRRASRNAMTLKPESILDVDEDAVVSTFRSYNIERMIHGHTHRPATHVLDVDGRSRERVVLSDWHDIGYYLEVDDDGMRSKKIRGDPAPGAS